MKVALVSSGSGSRGGGEIYLRLLADGLSAMGCEVHALVPATERMDEIADGLSRSANVHRLPLTTTYERRFRNIAAAIDIKQQCHVARQLLALSPDVVHLNQQVAEDGLDFIAGAARSGLPWLSTIHIARSAASLGARAAAMRDFVTHLALRRSSGLYVTVSEASQRQLAKRLGNVPPDLRIVVVHNGVPTPDPSRLSRARAHARREWGIADDEVVVGAVGRIEAQKNPLALVDHIRPFLGSGPRLRLVWIGDGQMREKLAAYADAAAPQANLHIDGWRDDVGLRMAGFDVFLLPSLYEGLPLALLEAMHAGLPVIAARTDGTPEAIESGVTGCLCETPEDFEMAIASLVGDRNLRERLGVAASEIARSRFSVTAMAGRTRELYSQRLALGGHA